MTSIERTESGAASKSHNRRVAVVAGALVLGLLGSGGLVLRGTEAAFTASTDNPANSWTVGSVALSDDRGGSAMFSAAGMMPGNTVTKCITVTYTGSGTAPVKLYSPVSVLDTLGDDLQLTVEQTNAAPGTAVTEDCTNFGASTPIVPTGDITAFTTKTTYGTGVAAWSPSANDSRVYKFTVTLKPGTLNAEMGKTATATFKWEAQA